MTSKSEQKRVEAQKYEKPHKGIIVNWYVLNNMVYGEVHGHPTYPEGYPIHTSRIVKLKEHWVETTNSMYSLGREYNETY